MSDPYDLEKSDLYPSSIHQEYDFIRIFQRGVTYGTEYVTFDPEKL